MGRAKDHLRMLDEGYSLAERQNLRAVNRAPDPAVVRRVVRYYGIENALERWGHIYCSRTIKHIAASVRLPGERMGSGFVIGEVA